MSLYQSLPGTGRLPGFITLLSLLLLTAFATQARQQQHTLPRLIPRSHDAVAVSKANRIPAGESAGIADVNITLADLQIGSFALPITLRYHSNGLKVNEVPSSLGDGWSLHYGGMISFRQHGLNDFKTAGLFDGGISSASMTMLKSFLRGHMTTGQQHTWLDNLINSNADAEFDQYQYSYPGKSGAYYYDTLMNVVTVPKNDIRVFRGNNEIRVLDNQNNNYYFGTLEQSTVTDASVYGYTPAFDDVATYYLSRIVTSQNRTILFRYRKYSYSVQQQKSAVAFSAVAGTCSADNGQALYTRTVQINCLLPDSVIYDQGYVKFAISTIPREDIKALQDTAAIPSITGLSIFAGNNKKIKSYSFLQGYFDTNKRLKLSGVQEWNGDATDKLWQFHYYREQDAFPAMSSNDQDHWGYYNAAGNAGMIPDIDYASLIPGWNAPAANYGNRSANIAARYGMLQTIIHPTGGSTAFEYEPNQVRVEDYNTLTTLSPFLTVPGGTPVPYAVGGVRIKTIITNDSIGTPSSYRTYQYADSLNQVAFLDIPYYIAKMEYNRDSAGACLACGQSATVFDESVWPLDAIPVIYSHITVSDSSVAGRQGKTESVYLLPENHTVSNTAPYVTPLNTSWQIGTLVNRKLYALKDNVDELVKEYRYTYKALEESYQTTGVKTNYAQYCTLNTPDNNNYNTSLSTFFSDRFYLQQSKEIDYLSGQTLTKQIDYAVSGIRHNLPAVVSYPDSKGDTIKERIIYSWDYDTTTTTGGDALAIRNLGRLNVLVPIERIQIRTIDGVDYVVGATLTNYRTDRPFPDRIYELNVPAPIPLSAYTTSRISGNFVRDSRYELVTTFSMYDSNNNVTETTGIDGVPVSYLYGYKQLYKIAEITTSSRPYVAYTSFETDERGGWAYSGTPVVDATSPVGERCYDLSTGTFGVGNIVLPTAVLTYWSKSPTPFVFPRQIPFQPATSGRTVNGWTFHMHWLSGQFPQDIVFPSSGFIDDVRVFPLRSQIKSYSYQPHTGMTSECDDRGNITYYSYDETGRLKMVQNGDRAILKLIDYQYMKPITE
ncbi:hypothetical protein [Chitinophaga pinensis]|uniref:YD repeat-containing protein n=1 Tax=Chitinophaga pinensis (strain ATCC 43595 / DSM 2588 / LMG 13176 / NBRC 15968 / NCIMB 11800 / UQM 2034) TaxID=485918 RepID=A0A979GT48_CHIPD|nr:hypothetical protein [Chitinophaga pinensis]ACU61833.1 hypothetical protein Cpin_4387 [Chitinophaga pinensis DSM 2588]